MVCILGEKGEKEFVRPSSVISNREASSNFATVSNNPDVSQSGYLTPLHVPSLLSPMPATPAGSMTPVSLIMPTRLISNSDIFEFYCSLIIDCKHNSLLNLVTGKYLWRNENT